MVWARNEWYNGFIEVKGLNEYQSTFNSCNYVKKIVEMKTVFILNFYSFNNRIIVLRSLCGKVVNVSPLKNLSMYL